MNIRLNKVIRELNVGIDTIVDYLRENGFEVNATPNEKINDEQYDLLKKKFGADKDLRKEADKLFSGHQAGKAKNAKEKKALAQKAQVIKTEIPENMRPGFKTVGQIDLDNKTVVKPQAQEGSRSSEERSCSRSRTESRDKAAACESGREKVRTGQGTQTGSQERREACAAETC